MRKNTTVAKEVVVATKKEKQAWSENSARDFIAKARTKGLKYWSAVDYMSKVHGVAASAWETEQKKRK